MASASRTADPGVAPGFLRADFSVWSHTSDQITGTPVATLPSAWHCKVSAVTGWRSILGPGEICNLYLSVVALKIVGADPSLRLP